MEIHGDVRTDDYYWLNNRENPDVIHYLNQENAYTEAVMKDSEPFQTLLYEEMVGRIKQDDAS
ncbi:MAG: oligopeptidase B, partial [bacterium]